MITCTEIVKKFGDFTALDHVSLHVPSGVFALVGPNGAGKSTLLKICTGLLSAGSGSVQIAGRNVKECKKLIGVVPEDLGLFDSLTIEEHLYLTGPIYGLTRENTQSRSEELLSILNLSKTRQRYLGKSSHGMRKKTALAMALLYNPKVLFLDEPFEGIDPASSKTLQLLLQYLSRRGVTVFLTSHLLPVVEELADSVAIINGGRIVWQSGAGARSLASVYFDFSQSTPLEGLAWLGYPPS